MHKTMLEHFNINITSNVELVYIPALSPTREPTPAHTDNPTSSPIPELAPFPPTPEHFYFVKKLLMI